MRRDSASAACIPLRIREIVEEGLSVDNWEKNLSTLSTENSVLMKELEKTKQLLVDYQKSSVTLSPAKKLAVSITCLLFWLFSLCFKGIFWWAGVGKEV